MATTTAAPTRASGQDLAIALSKIRHHTASKLDNQRAPAQLLVAIEATLDEQRSTDDTEGATAAALGERNPTEYFLALEATLVKAAEPDAPVTLLPSSLYLLSIVAPFVSPAVMRARLASLIEPLVKVLSNPHPTGGTTTAENHAALLRSTLGVHQALVLALSTDRATLDGNLRLRGCWNAVLDLCTDSRPKVRRRAQEVITAVLDDNAHGSSHKAHPYSARTAEWAIKTLESVANAGGVAAKAAKKKQKEQALAPEFDKKSGKAKGSEAAAAARQQQASDGGASAGIWVCGFLKLLAPNMPGKYIAPLCTVLLRLPGLTNPFLTVAAFEVFESLFRPSRPLASADNPLAAATPLITPHSSRTNNQADSLVRTLDALSSPAIAPSESDAQLLPPYLRALEHALVAYSRIEQGAPAWARTPAVWAEIFDLSLSARSKSSRENPAVRSAGRDALAALARYCIPDAAIDVALKTPHAETPLSSMISLIADALGKHALRFNHSRPEILAVLAALISRLRYRPAATSHGERATPAAATLLLALVQAVADLRAQPAFEHRESADAVIGAAVEVCGPKLVLEALPLGLLGENDATGGRAWMMPLMRGKITNTELVHFTGTMVSLSESLFNRRAQAEELGADGKMRRPIEAKVYEALTDQVWALFPGYCDLPVDLTSALSPHFVQLLANVLYTQPTLRPSVCRGLQVLVERNEALTASGAPSDVLKASFGLDQEAGRANIAHLAGLAPTLLAVFFNVFSQSPGESRGYVAESLAAYLRVTRPADIAATYVKVVGMLQTALPDLMPAHERDVGSGVVPPVPHTMLDLLVALIPFLDASSPKAEATQLFDLACSDELLRAKDAGVQKKTYRILARLIDGSRGAAVLQVGVAGAEAGRVAELLRKLRDATPDVVAGAKRDRVALFAALVPRIPATELHFLPSIIPEAVLATKEANQGTRELAYDLLVAMGRKMEAGGSIKRGLVEGAAGDDSDDEDEGMQPAAASTEDVAEASVTEYITMVAAGLAGATPHMISASITALSRLVYEFRNDLSHETLHELLSTLEVFIRSANREIVKSALGFVKVVTVSLPPVVVDSHLPSLVPSLFAFSPQHRQHFKSKVRHIFERLLRRFGFDRISALTGEEDRKLLNNIRKRKERAKRRKTANEEAGDNNDDDDDAFAAPGSRALKSHGVDAFEEVIYGSESEGSDSDDEVMGDAAIAQRPDARGARGGKAAPAPKRTRKPVEEAYIREDNDSPMDLLDRSATAGGGVTTVRPTVGGAKSSRARRPGQDAARFDLDEATGRMLIDDSEETGARSSGMADANDVDGAGRAYIDRERGTHGITMRDGVARINKNNKRNRAEEEELDDEQMQAEDAAFAAAAAQAGAAQGQKTQGGGRDKKQKREKTAIGAEFRAKRAQGDVSRDGKSPYAYVPLAQIGGKKGKKGAAEMDITGKGKKSSRGRS